MSVVFALLVDANNPKRFVNRRFTTLSLFIYLSLVCVSLAQPPAVRRFFGSTVSGGTAFAPPQGSAQGDPLNLTYSIIPDGTSFTGGGTSDLMAELLTGPSALPQSILDSAFERWAALSGITFEFEPNDDGVNSIAGSNSGVADVRGDVRLGGRNIDGPSGTLAFSANPSSDIVIDTADTFDTANNFLAFRNVLTHEVGHSLGLFANPGGHIESSDTNQLLEPIIDTSFDGPQYHDILSIQTNYGDFFEAGAGNDTIDVATQLGDVSDGTPVLLGESAHREANNSILFATRDFEIQPEEDDFISIDGPMDTDFFEITVDQAGFLDVVIDVLGETYSVGAPIQTEFDTALRSDLALQVLNAAGTTLATQNVNGLGGDEILEQLALESAGTYFIQVTGEGNPDALVFGDAQFYGLSVAFTAVPEPTSGVMILLWVCFLMVHRRRG